MIPADSIWELLKKKGYKFFAGVPCSLLQELLDAVLKDPELKYISAVRENAALGIASGARLAGTKAGILIQNSGLGNIVNALTSFNLIYKIPVLIFMTWRGYQGKDAPEHLIMGQKMLDLLEQLEIPFVILTDNYKQEIAHILKVMEEKSCPAAVIIKKGVIK